MTAERAARRKGNTRSVSYAGWEDFCYDVGIYGMFFGRNGHLGRHMATPPESHRDTPILAAQPGFAAINRDDLLAISKAIDRHVARFGDL